MQEELSPLPLDEFAHFATDKNGNLWWRGSRVRVEQRLRLNYWQSVGATLTVIAALVGAAGSAVQGWTAYEVAQRHAVPILGDLAPPQECVNAHDAVECAQILQKAGKNPFDAFGGVGREPRYNK